ncbi:MAG: hypothetical protein K2M95_07365 [Clostridiales bacterium]|nr:hypothetical protein [Clostridiales bacterium]
MWYDESIFYQIYPLGACGCEPSAIDTVTHRLGILEQQIDTLEKMGVGAVLLNPFLQSETHGYNTTDYYKIDTRLGTVEDMKRYVDALHARGIRVVADGVYNHCGREFFAFRDVREKKWDSPYRDWFKINFSGNSAYNDGFYYEGWEGHYDLVSFNLYNDDCANYLIEAAAWLCTSLGFDGIRLDVAYLLPEHFLRRLTGRLKGIRGDFFFVGEMIHGDYNKLFNAGVDAVTNYECYKGLYSSFNCKNMFEIEYALRRQSGNEPWALYRDKRLFNFADNHDVTRIYSILQNKDNLAAAYVLLLGISGIPCLYYGAENKAAGEKKDGDASLRPSLASLPPVDETLVKLFASLSAVKKAHPALQRGSYKTNSITNAALSFVRECDGDAVFFAVNCGDGEVSLGLPFGGETLDGVHVEGNITLPPHGYAVVVRK